MTTKQNIAFWTKNISAALLAGGIVAGCGSLRKVVDSDPEVGLALPRRTAQELAAAYLPKQDTVQQPQIITYRKEDGTELHFIPIDQTTGETSISIEKVVITGTGRFRNTVERNGKIGIEFIVSVPRKLQDKAWRVVATPQMRKGGDTLLLDPVVVSGEEFRAMQRRQYGEWENYLSHIVDSADYFNRFGNASLYRRWVERVMDERSVLSDMDRYLRASAVEEAMYDPAVGWTTRKERAEQYQQLRRYVRATENRMRRRYDASYSLGQIKSAREGIDYEDYCRLHAAAELHRDKVGRANPLVEKILRETGDSADFQNFRIRQMSIWSQFQQMMHVDTSSMKSQIVRASRGFRRNLRRAEMKDEVFRQLVTHPYIAPAKLDTVIVRPDKLDFLYRQEVEADENTSKLYVSLRSSVESPSARYELPASDTLTFNVASMTTFVDETPRYMQRIVLRDAEANARFFFTFPQGKARLADTVRENRRQIRAVRELTHRLMTDPVFIIDSITLRATSSPEGSWELNEKLSAERAEALKQVLEQEFRILYDSLHIASSYTFDFETGKAQQTAAEEELPNLPELLRTQSLAEDWTTLERLAQADDALPQRELVLELIGRGGDPDTREALLRSKAPEGYKYLAEKIYPRLRAVDFSFALHRRGQLQDTVYTTVLDSAYMQGVKYLKKRRYKEALSLLRPYEDRNTALAYMSLGYDKAALRILRQQPAADDTADIQYMMAILAARLADEKSAVQHLLRSAELLPRLRFRAQLDPELAVLVRKYGLFQEDFNGA